MKSTLQAIIPQKKRAWQNSVYGGGRYNVTRIPKGPVPVLGSHLFLYLGERKGEDPVMRRIAVTGEELPDMVKTPDRMVSLDAFRGATMAAMVLVNNPGRWAVVYSPLKETEWNGWTFADCIFPSFLFIVGVSIVFSFAKEMESAEIGKKTLLKILQRSCILFLLGLFLNGFPYYHLSELRVPGVLQRIALCYLAASFIVLKTRINTQVCILAGLLIAYGVMLQFIPVPGVASGSGSLEQGRNLASYIDGLLLPGHLWYNIRPYDPEGILSTIPAVGTTLFGVLTGHWLRSSHSLRDKAAGMLTVGFLLLFAGPALSVWIPINKGLWTSSFAILMAGMSMVCLAVFCWLIDVKGQQRVAIPLVIFGRNAIAAYLFSELLSKTIRVVEVARGGDGRKSTLKRYLFDTVYAPLASGKRASLLFAVSFVCLTFLVVWTMWRKRWFLRV
jgi:predicted acyltransferase